MTTYPSVILKKGRERSLLRRHPWIFSGAIARVEGSPGRGEIVDVLSFSGGFLCRGAYSPSSQITVRALTFDPGERIDSSWIEGRLKSAIAAREAVPSFRARTARRLVNAESDGLPGLIVDLYVDFLVCQFLAAGAEAMKDAILRILQTLLPVRGIYERSDADVRRKEGLVPRKGLLQGEEPPSLLPIREEGCTYLVDVKNGHKTGFYLDQAENRILVREYACGREVLNAFSYTGGFGISALFGGAVRVTNVDDSPENLDLARKNARENGMDPERMENVLGDVFHVLRGFRDDGRTFDLVVLDPPKFVDSRAHLESGLRGYKDINLLAFRILRPGGILATFSCSGLVEPHLFQKVVADGACDAGRNVRILRHLDQAPDHPVLLSFPEGRYLTGLLCLAE